ncbi:MAG TPA: transferrin-binding protein-like solute binding protein, partial [Rhizomicrobium sp.]|nr:transferrin-binding protein-like solute binding protein [Rhizomicrobium sp.]
FSVPSGSGTIQAGSLAGNVSLNVNFGSNTVTGTLSGMSANTTANGSGTTPWNNVSLSGNLSRSSTVSMAGATSTTGAPAGAGTPGFSGAATGTFSAQFYGPSGQEVGGSWTLYETTPAGGKSAVGTFAGR